MGKFEQFGIIAEREFVEEQLPVSAISKRHNLTDKTVHEWKQKGNWEEKRKQFLNARCKCFASLYELTQLLTAQVVEQVKTTGEMPESATLNFICKMSEKLPKLKTLEEIAENSKVEETKTSEDTQAKIAALIDKKLMGLD